MGMYLFISVKENRNLMVTGIQDAWIIVDARISVFVSFVYRNGYDNTATATWYENYHIFTSWGCYASKMDVLRTS